MNPAAQPLVELARQFLAGQMSAARFDERYRAMFASLPPVEDDTFLPLDYLFVECDAYVEDPALRDPPDDLDEDGLRAAAREALRRLGY